MWLDEDVPKNTTNEVHQVGALWAVGNDDHRFLTEQEANEYATWLAARANDRQA